MTDNNQTLTPGPLVGQSGPEQQQSLSTPPPDMGVKHNGNYDNLTVDTESQGSPAPPSSISMAGSGGQRSSDGKVFIGGLSWETNDIKLRQYFENFGEVQEAYVSYDRHTGRPRGFGFVVFSDPTVVDKVVTQQHTIDRREVEAKKALPKEESPVSKDMQAAASGQRTKKIFVGGLAGTVDEAVFREYFGKFGNVEDAVVMYDQHNRRPRGFGFITFSQEEAVESVFAKGVIHMMHGKEIEIKRAIPRDSGVLPSPKMLYRSPHERHYGFRTPGSSASKGRGFRHEYQIPAQMMGMHHHPIRGMDHSPMPHENAHRGIVTGIPANIVQTIPQDHSGSRINESQANAGRNNHMSPLSHHLMAQGLSPQHSPQVSGREMYGSLGQPSIPTDPSFPTVNNQGLDVGGMQNVQDTIGLVSVAEALGTLTHNPSQQPQSEHSPSAAQSGGQDGALWS